MDAESADKMRVGVETDDRSAPMIEPPAIATPSMVEASRRKSLGQIADNFKGMDAESAAKLNEGVETDDRSAPVIEPDVAPKHELINARRSSLKAIETGGEFKR